MNKDNFKAQDRSNKSAQDHNQQGRPQDFDHKHDKKNHPHNADQKRHQHGNPRDL